MTKKRKKEFKPWSFQKKVKLYKMYTLQGPKWREFAKELKTTADAVRNQIRRTDWDKLFRNHNAVPEEVLSGSSAIRAKDPSTKKEEALSVEEQAEILIEERKERLRSQAEARRVHEHLESLAQEELIYEKIAGAISRVPPIKLSEIRRDTPKTYKTSPQESFLLLSDLHIGLAVNPEEVGNLGNYNMEIFKQRLDNLIEAVCRITDLHRTTHKIDTINVAILGDLVHGSNDAGKWGFLHTEQTIIDQVFESVKNVTKTLLTLKSIYPKVNVYCVYGNHGRTAKRGAEKKFVNWDYLIYKWIETSLEKQKGMNFFVPKSTFNIAESMGKKFLLVHGDQARSWNQIPFYGLNRLESKFRGLFDRKKNLQDLWKVIKEKGIDEEDPEKLAKFIFNYVRSFDYMICFPERTKITTGDGTLKNIEKIKPKDIVVDLYGNFVNVIKIRFY